MNLETLYRQPSLILAAWLCGCVAGCMTMYPRSGYTTWKYSEPPLRATAPVTQATAKPDVAPDAEPTPQTDTAAAVNPEGDGPQITIRQKLDSPAPGPELMAPGSTRGKSPADGPLALHVLAPTAARLGQPVPFEIQLANRSASGVQDVVLECDFPAGLEFPGSQERQVQRPLGTLAAGATQTIPLSLTPTSGGRHCVNFRLTAKDQPAVEREVCLQVDDSSQLELQLVSPEQRRIGERAEVLLTIQNRSGRGLTESRVEVEYGAALTAREASAGVERADGVLRWNLDTLQIDERVQIQMEFECLSVQPRACVSVRVMTRETTASQESCWRIEPASEEVRLSVADSVDPVVVGEPLIYRLEVRNTGPTVVENWTIEVDTDDSLALDQARITTPADARQPQQQLDSGRLLLSGFPALAAGESLTIELPAHAVRAGRTDFQATIQTPRATTSFSEPTLINSASSAK